MKNTDRKAIGLELFYSTRSSSFSGLEDYTGEVISERVDDSSFFRLLPIAHAIRHTTAQLCSLGLELDDILPEDIAAMQKAPSPREYCSRKCVTRFYEWLISLSLHNEQNRVTRISSVNAVAARMDAQARSLLRGGFLLNNQRVVIARRGNDLTVSFAEREWGKVVGVFTDVCVERGDTATIPGYLFSVEAECLPDGRFGFSFLIDTRFSDNDYCERLLQDIGWRELSFSCGSVKTEAVFCDYAGRLDRLGTPRAELIDRVCSILMAKQSILGNDGLSPDEAAMLPFASFICGAGGLVTRDKSQLWRSEQLVLDSLDNRYAMQRFGELLRSSKCSALLERLDESHEARYEDDEDRALKRVKHFAYLYEQQLADGSSRALTKLLADRCCAMTSGFSGQTLRCDAESTVAEQIRGVVEPRLRELEFSGRYPHYRRERADGDEYISVMISPASDIPHRGVLSYYVSLAAAHISDRRLERLRLDGIEREQANALDCQPELRFAASYGELASADDGEYVRVDSDIYRRGRCALYNESKALERYIGLAERQFRDGHLPGRYSLSRLRHSQLPSPLPRLFLSTLPYSAVAALVALIAYLALLGRAGLPLPTPGVPLLASIGGCLVLNTLLTVLRRLFISRGLWRYR